MAQGEERPFLLDYSLKTSILQTSAHSLGGEGFIGDVSECSGDILGGFRFLGGDKVDSMSNIGWGEFAGAPTSGLDKARTMFGVNPRDGRGVNTSFD